MAKGFTAGRLLAVAMSVVVSGAMFYAQSRETERHPVTVDDAMSPEVAGALIAQAGAPAGPAPVTAATEAELLAASAPVAAVDYDLALPVGRAPEQGLQRNTIRLARAISVMFLEIDTIGGYREDPLPWHPNGLAIDVMIPNSESPEGIELGNQIAGYVLANAERWGVLHVIWRQGFYPGIGAPSWTADYGSPTLNHYDHLHIATDGGGYPTGNETYYFDSIDLG